MTCHPKHTMAKDGSGEGARREVTRIHKWKHGHDPQDDDATEASPWTYAKISGENMSEQPDVPPNPYAGMSGPDTGILCTYCGGDTFRVVDHRDKEDLIENISGYQWMLEHGTISSADNILMLICPKCEGLMQMREEVVRRKLSEKAGRSDG